MDRLIRATIVVATALVAAAVFAQSKQPLQRFPLHKPIPENGVTACTDAAIPIRLNTLMAEGREDEATKAFERALTQGDCLNGRGMVTYLRQVHRIDSPEGAVLTVYEASAGGVTFYVPMLGYLHEELMA